MDTKVMNNLSYGVFVCTAKEGDKDNGCIINTAMQYTTEPNVVGLTINKSNYTHDMVMRTGECNVCILDESASFDLIKHFGFQSGKDVNKFDDSNVFGYMRADNGIYYVMEGVNSYISCKVKDTIDLGTHTLFICDVTDGKVLNDKPSATYSYYHTNIKTQGNKVGENAEQTKDSATNKYVCKVCGYVYEGDELPEDYICPWCKHPASDFEKAN